MCESEGSTLPLESGAQGINTDLHWKPSTKTMLQKSVIIQGPKAGVAVSKKEQLSESIDMSIEDTTIIHTIYTKQASEINL